MYSRWVFLGKCSSRNWSWSDNTFCFLQQIAVLISIWHNHHSSFGCSFTCQPIQTDNWHHTNECQGLGFHRWSIQTFLCSFGGLYRFKLHYTIIYMTYLQDGKPGECQILMLCKSWSELAKFLIQFNLKWCTMKFEEFHWIHNAKAMYAIQAFFHFWEGSFNASVGGSFNLLAILCFQDIEVARAKV